MGYLFIFIFASFSIHSFPGDHITLTCIKHLAYKYDAASGKLVKDEENLKKYLDNLADNDDAKKARNKAVKAIHKTLKDYPALFEDPAIIAEIKKSIKESGYNKDVPITKWGDSLSDWIDHYGWLPYSKFKYVVMNASNQSSCFQDAGLWRLRKENLARIGK